MGFIGDLKEIDKRESSAIVSMRGSNVPPPSVVDEVTVASHLVSQERRDESYHSLLSKYNKCNEELSKYKRMLSKLNSMCHDLMRKYNILKRFVPQNIESLPPNKKQRTL